MRFQNIIFVIFCFLLIGQSCKKKAAVYVFTGIVNDDTYHGGLANSTIKIQVRNTAGTTGFEDYKISKADSEGKFSVDVIRDKFNEIRIVVSKANYFETSQVYLVDNLSVENENTVTLKTTAKSWIRLIFNNVTPQSSDQLHYTKQQGKKDCEGCCSNDEIVIYGAYNDTIYCLNDGNTKYSYLYYGSGISLNTKETTAAPFDTSTIYLEY
jgi:hypothetical protein